MILLNPHAFLVVTVLLLGNFFPQRKNSNPPLPHKDDDDGNVAEKSKKQRQKSATTSYQDISVLSWNILAPCYALPHHYRSQLLQPKEGAAEESVTDDYMDWSYRQNKIVEVIEQRAVDLVFLQEVQLDLWPEFHELLTNVGYETCVVQQVNRDLPVTTVILLHDRRKEEWKVVHVESRSRVLLVTLECQSKFEQSTKNFHLFLGNVHLQAGRREFVTRYQQVKSLLQRLSLQAQRVLAQANHQPLVLLMGDWNTLQTDPLHCLLTTGRLPKEHELPQLYPNLPLLPLDDVFEKVSSSSATTAQRTAVSWTHNCGAILDYIFASPCLEVIHVWSQEASLPIPNVHFPSDHRPIGGTLRIHQGHSHPKV